MKLFELFDHCPLADSLFEKATKGNTELADTLTYGNWTIKALRKPDAKGEYAAIGYHDRNPNTARMTGSTQQQAIDKVKAEIDRHVSNDEAAIRASKVTIDFNVEFTREMLHELGGPTGVRFEKRNGMTMVTVASPDYLDLGDEVFGTGEHQFQKLASRIPPAQDGSQAAMVYCTTMAGSRANSLGLVGGGRYTLEYLGSDDYQNQMFKLVFDSIATSREDKRRLRTPGLTVAVS